MVASVNPIDIGGETGVIGGSGRDIASNGGNSVTQDAQMVDIAVASGTSGLSSVAGSVSGAVPKTGKSEC